MTTFAAFVSPAAAALLVLPLAAQTVWLQVPTPVHPPALERPAMAHDFVRDRIVLWGGFDQGGSYRNDTWEFDGTAWAQRLTPQSPPAAPGCMCFDRGRLCMVLLVYNNGGPETWEYDGTTWTQRQLAVQPPASGNDGIVYDASRGTNVVWTQSFGFGGGETWEYNGFAWTQRFPNNAPSPRHSAGMVFDPLRGRTILHGGYAAGGPSAQTWEYDGTTWFLQPLTGQSPDRNDFAFSFDAHRRRAVMFGGYGSQQAGTFEYDTAGWQLRTQVGPPPVAGGAMVYDILRQENVLFGGRDLATNQLRDSTFRYRSLAPATVVPFGQGCAGASIAPGFLPQPYHAPYLGMPFGVRLYSAPFNMPSFIAVGFSQTTYQGVPLPLPLGFLGMTGCQLLGSADLTVSTTVSGANATWSFVVPQQPSLAGAQLFLQGFAFELGGNPANLINTRGLACTVGTP